MSDVFIAPIVEGHGEVYALPALLHRIKDDVQPDATLIVNAPIRIKASSFRAGGDDFKRHLMLASEKAHSHQNGSVLILLDDEDGCPRDSGPQLLTRALAVRADARFTVVMAYREYETWFLAAARSLRGCCGLPDDLEPPDNPEAFRGAKEWLTARMGVPYDPPNHQLLMTRAFDLTQGQQVPSFARLHRKISGLLTS